MNETVTTLELAESLLAQRHVSSARFLFDRAETQGAEPDRCAGGRWMTAMLSGHFEGAWRESDSIRLRRVPDPHRLWNGESLRGQRVIVRCLHGFGDAVQFLRYAPRIRNRAAHLIVQCAPPAVELMRCLPGVDEVITWNSCTEAQPRPWDVQLEVMEIPYIFRTRISHLPIATNYLQLPQSELERAARALAPYTSRPRVGIVWSAGEWNTARSVPLHLLSSLLSQSDFEFWNLQGGAVREEWSQLNLGTHLHDTPLLADRGLLPLAAVLAHLDLVITVDTLAAHLAGALGVPCFLLLQYAADWRWMINRDDSPWYPSLRLFRQPVSGDWPSAIRQVSLALTAHFKARNNSGLAA